MKKLTVLFAVALFSLSYPALSQEQGMQPTQAIVRVPRSEGTVINKADVQIKVNGHGVPVSRWRPLVGRMGSVELAILIDDGLRGNFATNVSDIKRFAVGLPPTISAAVGYMQNGRVNISTGFTTDRDAIGKSVRIPIGQQGVSGSAYFCLSDLAKNWPTKTGLPRVVVMITNGIDYYNGSTSPLNQDSPYVETAVRDAQRNGVTVYAIPWNNSSFGGGQGSFSGQNYLSQVAEGTGGELLTQGSINPPNIAPYLEKLQHAMSESYVAGFDAPAGKRGVQLKVSVKGQKKVRAPQFIYAGNAVE